METQQTPHPGNWIVVDLEATCWQGGSDPERMETIEIGAVRLDADGQPTRDEFSCFVRPVGEPILSEFCHELTGISQPDVDSADPFPAAFAAFRAWAGSDGFTWGSWGVYDLLQLRRDCARHGTEWPQGLRHHNLKQLYAVRRGSRARGMKKALAREGIPLEGAHHRALDDARNIAKLVGRVLGSAGA